MVMSSSDRLDQGGCLMTNDLATRHRAARTLDAVVPAILASLSVKQPQPPKLPGLLNIF